MGAGTRGKRSLRWCMPYSLTSFVGIRGPTRSGSSFH